MFRRRGRREKEMEDREREEKERPSFPKTGASKTIDAAAVDHNKKNDKKRGKGGEVIGFVDRCPSCDLVLRKEKERDQGSKRKQGKSL